MTSSQPQASSTNIPHIYSISSRRQPDSASSRMLMLSALERQLIPLSILLAATILYIYQNPTSLEFLTPTTPPPNPSTMSKNVLLLGGHGKISLLMTPLLLQRSWNVTSVIRNPDQKPTILSKGAGQPGKLDVLISSLDDIKTESAAASVINQVNPDYIIWSAGAGGQGGPDRTYAVDRDAAKAYIGAAARNSSVKKFLLVSYTACRRAYAPWWDEEDKKAADKTNYEILPHYYKAKIEADEYLTALAKQRPDFETIDLRPGTLTDDPAGYKVSMGKTRSRGKVSRADVADVAVKLLEKGATGWVDLLAGDEDTDAAIDRVVKEKIDAVEGEDVDSWVQKHKL